jgi:hypothetical protein
MLGGALEAGEGVEQGVGGEVVDAQLALLGGCDEQAERLVDGHADGGVFLGVCGERGGGAVGADVFEGQLGLLADGARDAADERPAGEGELRLRGRRVGGRGGGAAGGGPAPGEQRGAP